MQRGVSHAEPFNRHHNMLSTPYPHDKPYRVCEGGSFLYTSSLFLKELIVRVLLLVLVLDILPLFLQQYTFRN